MLTYFITRFSIFDYKCKSFRMTQDMTFSVYKRKLFDEKRMEYKFESFEKITLPSIVNQTNKNYIWEIYSSTFLPSEYKKRLLRDTKKYKNIKLFFINSFEEFFLRMKELPYGKIDKYCTVRLDDDDGLSNNYIEKVNQYSEKTGSVISFPNGQFVTIENSLIKYGRRHSKLNNAQGLCAIGMNIFNLGRHKKIHEKKEVKEVIYNFTPDMYLVNCGIFCDTQRKFKEKRKNES